MTTFFLLIPDSALRESVDEQLNVAKIGEVRSVENVSALLKQAEGEKNCVIVIDETVYDKKAAASLRIFLDKQLNVTVLMLGTRDQDVEDINETFLKPFRLGHLVTRIRYYAETAPLLRDKVVDFGPYKLEPHNRRILCESGADPIKLTEKETALLMFLADRAAPVKRSDILAGVWGYGEGIDTHTLETHIYGLRRKLDKDSDSWLVFEAGAYHLARVKA
jgi:DNA-binding response OmpR family regulator